jgi:PAS domain-containing protein
MRFGAPVASLILLALALIESAAFIAGRGPLQARPQDAILAVWSFILIMSMLGMLITSLLAERDAAYRRQALSEMRYRVLFDSSPRPLWLYDPTNLRILMVNEAAVRLYGYSREEFTDLSVSALMRGTHPAPRRRTDSRLSWTRASTSTARALAPSWRSNCIRISSNSTVARRGSCSATI